MMIKSILTGSVLLATSGSALASGKQRSSTAGCSYSSVTKASSKSEKVVEKLAKEINVGLCEGNHPQVDFFEDIAQSSAFAFADAIAAVEYDCSAKGNAKFQIKGESIASAQAKAMASAYAKAITKASTCGVCYAESEAVAETVKEVYLNATAEIKTNITGHVSNGGSIDDAKKIIADAYIDVTLEAFASVLLDAKADVDSCFALANVEATAGDNTIICEAQTLLTQDIDSIPAIARTSSEVAVLTCDGISQGQVETTAEALAEAFAVAIAKSLLSCDIDGEGYGCATSMGNITTVSKAVAKAFAFGAGKAISECSNNCTLDVSATTEALAYIVATAFQDVNEKLCVNSTGAPDADLVVEYDTMEQQLVKAAAPALAKSIVEAIADATTGCTVNITIDAGIGNTTTVTVPGGSIDRTDDGPPMPHPTTPAPHPATESSDEEDKSPSPAPKKVHRRRGGKKAVRRVPKKGRRAPKKTTRTAPKKTNRRAPKKIARRVPKKTVRRAPKKAVRRAPKKTVRRAPKKAVRRLPKKVVRRAKKGPRRGKPARK